MKETLYLGNNFSIEYCVVDLYDLSLYLRAKYFTFSYYYIFVLWQHKHWPLLLDLDLEFKLSDKEEFRERYFMDLLIDIYFSFIFCFYWFFFLLHSNYSQCALHLFSKLDWYTRLYKSGFRLFKSVFKKVFFSLLLITFSI